MEIEQENVQIGPMAVLHDIYIKERFDARFDASQ